MYLSKLVVENFRIFGKENGQSLALELDPGLNLLVGENDSGKTAVVDAIRLLVGTASNESFTVGVEDFHTDGTEVARELLIEGHFRGLTAAENAALLEYLSIEYVNGVPNYYLRLCLVGERREPTESVGRRRREVVVNVRAHDPTEGKLLDADARDCLRAIYLKPLRDALQELAAKQGSRLSQILYAHPDIRSHEVSDWSEDLEREGGTAGTLLGIMQQAEYRLKGHNVIREAERSLNTDYLAEFSFEETQWQGSISMRSQRLRQILERMELFLDPRASGVRTGNHGLGVNNLLFMATELLLLGTQKEPCLPLLLIEEPEAHLHPQLQLRLMEYLEMRVKEIQPERPRLQVVLTSHSPNLASKVELGQITILQNGKAFRMSAPNTCLDPSDYSFLRRFLDVTKANLFFARGVLMVEGDAEHMLLPTIAELLDRSLSKHAVSIVNVGHVGLFRYSKIFQRRVAPAMDIRVACVTDRDIPAVEAAGYLQGGEEGTDGKLSLDEVEERIAKRRRFDGGPVETFVSPHWTLEFDLAASGLAAEVRAAVQLARETGGEAVAHDAIQAAYARAEEECKASRDAGLTNRQTASWIYEDLYRKRASKAVTAQILAELLSILKPADLRARLPLYLLAAIDHACGRVAAPVEDRDA
jgi:putative ATP-dependent endonuclease of OLD family